MAAPDYPTPVDDLTRRRGEVIERTINVETMVDAVITKHYCAVGGLLNYDFMFEVLYHPYMNTGIKLDLLQKACLSVSDKTIRHLRALFGYRNHFAHRGAEVFSVEQAVTYCPDPDKPADPAHGINWDTLYAQFDSLCATCTKEMKQLVDAMQIRYTTEPPAGLR